MALKTTVQSGLWSDGATWSGGTKPVTGDEIELDHTVYADESFDIGVGTDSATYWAMTINDNGRFVVANRTSDASTDLVFTFNGGILFTSSQGGRFFIGTEDGSEFGSYSVGPIPATRKIDVYFSNDYAHTVKSYNWDGHGIYDSVMEIWGAPNFHQRVADEVTTQTVDSASNKYSFTDAARSGDADNLWRGAWLEIISGTNAGECREVTANSGGLISWSSDQPMPLQCDSTSVYTIKQCYHRALLTADADAGTNTIVVDRLVDWEVNDELLIGCGAAYQSTTDMPERVKITGKTDAKTYTITLATDYGGPGNFAYDHKIDDFVVHLTKNVTFNCNISGSVQGYYFTHNTLGNPAYHARVVANWVFFDRCGYSTNALFSLGQGIYHPILRNITFFGYLDGTTVPSSVFMSVNDPRDPNYRTPMIEEIHGGNLGGLFKIELPPSAFNTLQDNFDSAKQIVGLTLIGASAYSGKIISSHAYQLATPIYKNLWVTGVPFFNSTYRYGYVSTVNTGQFDGFRVYRVRYGFTFSGYPGPSTYGYLVCMDSSYLKNGVIKNTIEFGDKIESFTSAKCVIENVWFLDCGSAGLVIINTICSEIRLNNNKYDDNNYGILLDSNQTSRVLEYNGSYGETYPNITGNVVIDTNYFDNYARNYISEKTRYNEPTSPFLTQSEFYKIFNLDSSVMDNRTIPGLCGAFSGLEANNPIVDGTPQHSVGLVHGGSIVEVLDHPSDPRTNSNIKFKIQPGTANGPCYINFRIPLLTYVAEGETVTASIYLRKNISMDAGSRPKLHASGYGINELTAEMSDVNDTWEQVSISFVAQSSGIINFWLSCRTTYKYDITTNDGNAEYGEPNDWGTVVVYADELVITVV